MAETAKEDYTSLTHVSPGLTQDRLNRALSDWFKEDVIFTRWEYVGATGKGDSYLSEVIRITIYGKTAEDDERKVQVVLKNIPKSKARRLTFRSDEFFKNEIMFYNHVLKALLEFQATKKIDNPFTEYVKVFLTYSDGIHDCLCLEDASVHGFRPAAVRQQGIDIEHCEVTIRTMAKFHALSFAMKDQLPEEFERISSYIFETYYAPRLWGWYERFWDNVCRVAINAVATEYPGTVYEDKVKAFAVPERYQKMCEAASDRTNGVISHGDSWTNNFLYRYSGDVATGAKMIDFQLTRCASPVLDLAFLIYACTTQALRDEHYTRLLDLYHTTLAAQIKALGTDPAVYSRTAFLNEVKKYSFFGLAFSFESTPFIVLEPEDAVDMNMEGEEKMDINDVWRQIGNFKTKEGRLREANNVKHCVDNGYI